MLDLPANVYCLNKQSIVFMWDICMVIENRMVFRFVVNQWWRFVDWSAGRSVGWFVVAIKKVCVIGMAHREITKTKETEKQMQQQHVTDACVCPVYHRLIWIEFAVCFTGIPRCGPDSILLSGQIIWIKHINIYTNDYFTVMRVWFFGKRWHFL